MNSQPTETTQQLEAKKVVDMYVGADPAMNQMWTSALKAAYSDRPTLVVGEIGSGKEKISRAIAVMRQLVNKLDISDISSLNINAISPQLLESEFFGHVQGAFSGAVKERKGEFEEHKDGVVVLDEMGELPIDLQVKLHRVLEEPQTFRRVGANNDIKFNGKVVCATNRNLVEMVRQGTFKQDLFSRLISGTVVEVPPLRSRSEEHRSGLIDYFVTSYTRKRKTTTISVSDSARDLLLHGDYEFNVRSLRNLVEAACIEVLTSNRKTIDKQDVEVASDHFHSSIFTLTSNENSDASAVTITPFALPASPESRAVSMKDVAHQAEKDAIRRTLESNQYNRVKTARELGISRVTLYNKMKKFGMLDAGNVDASDSNHSASTNGFGRHPVNLDNHV